MPLSKNIQKIISLLVKLAIVVFAFWYIYKKIFEKEEITEIIEKFKQLLNSGDYGLFIIVCILMAVNWGIESYKWRYLISKIEKISFFHSVKALLAGATFSVFTPYRVGEYGGRILMLKSADRLEAILLTLVGNFSQLIVTVTIGILSSIYYIRTYTEFGQTLSVSLYIGLIFWALLMVGVILFFFVNSRILSYGIYKLKFLGKYKKYGRAFSYFNSDELLKVITLSLLRYLTFSTQFYLLLKVFGINIFLPEAFILINMTFFAMSALPSIAIAELGVRGSIAIYFIGLLANNDFAVLTSTFTLWLINLIIPAIIGCVFIFNLKFIKKE